MAKNEYNFLLKEMLQRLQLALKCCVLFKIFGD